MKKKLLLDCRFWGPSHTGLGRYTESLTRALHQLPLTNWQVYCLINPGQKRSILKALPKFEPILVSARPYSFKEQRELPGVVKRLKPDLTHYLHFNVPLFSPQPFVVTIHDLIKHHSKGFNTTTRTIFTYPFKRLGYHAVVSRAVKSARLIIAPSAWVKTDILAHYKLAADKSKVVDEAAASSYFKSTSADKKLAPKEPYFIYVGNAYPHKNVLQLIKAMQVYNHSTSKPVKLVIITAKDFFYQQLRLKIRELKAQNLVLIQGFTSDRELRALLHYSLAFITASKFEGFGLPGLEAMAAGTLTLASNRTSLPEVYGESAWYFNPDKPDEIVRAITRVIKLTRSQRLRRISLGRKNAKKLSWNVTAFQTFQIYETSLNLRSGQ